MWREIDKLRDQLSDHKAALRVNERDVVELRADINGVGEKVGQSEQRVKRYVDDAVGGLTTKIDRGVSWLRWVVGISIPLIAGLAGALIRGG